MFMWNLMMKMMFKILFFTSISTLMVGALSHEARVLELSDKFLEFRKEGMWLVKFYAPWCGHCKRLEPIFNHVAQALHDTPIRVAKVDCTRFPSVSNEFKVTGFPTIIFMKNGVNHVYNGERKLEDISMYARRMAGPAVKDLRTSGSMDKYNCNSLQCVFENVPLLFGYIGKQEGALWDSFTATANKFQSHCSFYAFDEKEVPEQWRENGDFPSIFVRKEGEESFFHDPSIESPSVVFNLTQLFSDWVKRERFYTFTEISRGNFQDLLDTGKFLVMTVVEEDKLGRITPEMADFKSMLESVVFYDKSRYHEKFQFGWVAHPSLANSLAMMDLPVPSLLVINSTTLHHHIPDDDAGHLTEEAIHTFLESILNESARAYGGKSWGTRVYRAFYEGKTGLVDMWTGNPILTIVIFGLPLGFLSLIFYSICCADFMDASEEEEEPEPRHEKKD